MLHLSMSFEDAAILREILEAALVDLRRELWHTDAREYRDLLRDRVQTLERMLDELKAESAPVF
ncbi:MAG: hypothetical protein ACM36C_04335 [Acidobacteriota bacterium]